jgi:hypothetical protein
MPNENPITYEELSEEHKQRYDEIKAAFEADLLGSFERTRHHDIRWKGFSSEGALNEVDLSTPTEERTRALRQEVNYIVAHSLHRARCGARGAGNYEIPVLFNRTCFRESQRGVAFSIQTANALRICRPRAIEFSSICHIQGGR